MIGARGKRMFQIAARHADLWNGAWPNRPEHMQPRLELLNEACRLVGRDPATLGRTAGVMMDMDETSPDRHWIWTRMARDHPAPMAGSSEEIAAALKEYQQLGIEHVQV